MDIDLLGIAVLSRCSKIQRDKSCKMQRMHFRWKMSLRDNLQLEIEDQMSCSTFLVDMNRKIATLFEIDTAQERRGNIALQKDLDCSSQHHKASPQ